LLASQSDRLAVALDRGGLFLDGMIHQRAGRPLLREGKPCRRGKSGLHGGKAPGKSRRAGSPVQGQRRRNQTAALRCGKGETVG